MNNLLQQIDGLKKELEGLQPIEAEFQRKLDRKFRLEFNYNSNHLEGNTLTYGETELLLYFDQTKGDHTMREYEEMQAHDLALKLVKEWAEDEERPLSEADICDLNKIILVRPYWKKAKTLDGQQTRRQISVGKYKEYPNSVELENGEIFEYAAPRDVPVLMEELIKWFRVECDKKEIHPVELAALLHYKFVLIHPFDDGNGRISRLLMNYVFWRFGYPPIIIKSKDKPAYLRALNRADVGEMEFFVEYIGKQVLWSLALSVKAAKGESVEEADDVDKELELLRRELNSKKTIIDNKGDYQNVVNIIENSLFPLFQLLEAKLEVLNDFFMDKERMMNYSLDGKEKYSLFEYGDDWQNLIQHWLQNRIYKEEFKINDLHYSFEFRGFVKVSTAPSFELKLDVFFEDYQYLIFTSITKNDPFKYSYDTQLTKEQRGQIINPLVQNLIEQIRQNTTQPN